MKANQNSRLELPPFLQHLLTSYVRLTPLVIYLSNAMREKVLAVIDSDGIILETNIEKQIALIGTTDHRADYYLQSFLQSTLESIEQLFDTLPFALRDMMQQIKRYLMFFFFDRIFLSRFAFQIHF